MTITDQRTSASSCSSFACAFSIARNALTRLHELHKIPDVADEAERQLAERPRLPIGAPLAFLVALAHRERARRQGREIHLTAL